MAYVSWETKRQAAKIADAKARARQTTADAAMLGAQADMAQALASMRAPEVQAPDFGDMPSGGGAPQPQPLMSTGSSSSPSDVSTPAISKPLGMQPLTIESAFDFLSKPDKVRGYAPGGPVRGPQGLDQVPAEMPDGSPARLNEGEYVQPREEVVAYAVQMLGERAKGLTEDQLNEIGLKLLSQRTEVMTGRKPGPEMVRPLPGQGQGMVPGMAGGSGGALAPAGTAAMFGISIPEEEDLVAGAARIRRAKAAMRTQADVAREARLQGESIPQVTTPQLPPTTPQADPHARAIARDMATQRPQTEQDLLNQITPQGAQLTREGRVFRYEDPVAMQPGRAAPVESRVIRGRGGAPVSQEGSVSGGWLAGRPQAGRMLREAKAYDHLPISGVTYSDSIGGTALGQIRPPKIDSQTAAALDQRYEQDAVGRAAERQVMGMDPRPELVNRPAVSEQQAKNLGALRRGLDLARIQTQAQKPVDQGKAAKEARDAEKHLRWQQENFMKDAVPYMEQASSMFGWLGDGGATYFQRASKTGQQPRQALNMLKGAYDELAKSSEPLFTVSNQPVTGTEAMSILNGETPFDSWYARLGDKFYEEAFRRATEAVQNTALRGLSQ